MLPFSSFQQKATKIILLLVFSLVDGLTGQLVEKSDPTRRVTSYYEGKPSQLKKYRTDQAEKVLKKKQKNPSFKHVSLVLGRCSKPSFI
jgi:hypothetical protein